MQIFDLLLINPMINILLAIYHLLLFLHIPSPLGFSIILLTICIRFLLYPVMASQIKSSKKMQELSPQINALRDKHKGDATRVQQETLALYKQHGYNPVSGCLPLLVQLPVIWSLYGVLQRIVHTDTKTLATINHVAYASGLRLQHIWDTHFFGLPLGQTPQQLLGKLGYLILLVPIVTGLLQFIQSKLMFASQPKPQKTIVKKTDAKPAEDFAQAFQTQSLFIFPLLIGWFSFGFPVGLSLYWNTFSIFGIIQQYKIQKLGGMQKLPVKK